MQNYGATQSEIEKYGHKLSLWQSLALLQKWSPMLSFGQRFIAAIDPYAKAVVVSEACEWLASKTDSGLDDELVKHLAAVLKTKEGENLVRWAVAKAEGMKA